MAVAESDHWFTRQVWLEAKALASVRRCQWLVGHMPTWKRFWGHTRLMSDKSELCLCGSADDVRRRLEGCFVWENKIELRSGDEFLGSGEHILEALCPACWPVAKLVYTGIGC